MSLQHENSAPSVAAPVASVVLPKTRSDWRARIRADARETERYTRFVFRAKRVLLATAGVLFALIVIYALQPRQPSGHKIEMIFKDMRIVGNDLAMDKPRLTGADDEGDPYVVTADIAIQDHLDSKRARLQNVEGDVTLKNGTWISATAPRGVLDATHPSQQTLSLSGSVAIFSDKGYEVHTAAANVEMGTGLISGKSVVTGQGPLGTFRADRFKVDREKKIVYLYGNVRMTIYAHGVKGS